MQKRMENSVIQHWFVSVILHRHHVNIDQGTKRLVHKPVSSLRISIVFSLLSYFGPLVPSTLPTTD